MESKNNTPPGPGSHYFKNFFRLSSGSRLNWFQELYPRYGDTVRAKVFHQDIYITRDPELIKEVLQKPDVFGKHSLAFKTLGRIANGLFNSEGSYWLTHRKLVQPLFNKAHLVGYHEEMISAVQSQLQELKDSGKDEIELTDLLDRVILDITFRCIYGIVADKEMIDKLCKMGNYFMRATQDFMKYNGLPDAVLFLLYPNFKKQLRDLDALTGKIIEQRRKAGFSNAQDMLGVLVRIHDESPEELPEKRLKNEIITFLFAGFITTSHSISWTYHLLLQNKSYLDDVEDLASRLDLDKLRAIETNEEIRLIRQVFYESIRLFPPIPILPRRIRTDVDLGPYRIPARSEIYIDVFGLNRHPNYWNNHTDFDPSRFDSDKEKRIQNIAYLPWGGGVRKCIGVSFSIQEAVLVIGELSKALSLTPRYDHVEMDLTITLKPKKLPVKITWRN